MNEQRVANEAEKGATATEAEMKTVREEVMGNGLGICGLSVKPVHHGG